MLNLIKQSLVAMVGLVVLNQAQTGLAQVSPHKSPAYSARILKHPMMINLINLA